MSVILLFTGVENVLAVEGVLVTMRFFAEKIIHTNYMFN